MGVARKEEVLLSRCSVSCLLTFLSCATKATGESTYTLNQHQTRGLASIIELAGESDEEEAAGEHSQSQSQRQSERRRCIETLVRAADAAFTAEASSEERSKMWNVDEGIDAEAASSLRRRVAARLRGEAMCADLMLLYPEAHALRRAAHALVNSCLAGRSAHFKTEQSVADQFLALVGPGKFWMTVVAVLALAVGGACAFVDWLVVENVLGPRVDVRPCECRLCERRIELGPKVGAGGFGAVWRCKDPLEGVVVKLVKVDLERDVNALRLALDEAKHLLELKHPHVVAYYDMWVHRDLRDLVDAETSASQQKRTFFDYFCIAMEDCQGGTLLDHVASGIPFPLEVVARVTIQCAAALDYVHARGIVHRDVKLENIFVKLGPPVIKIGDFGLAVRNDDALFRAGTKASPASAAGGTEAYQAPECFEETDDSPTGPAVDAWALGCALYEMTTCVSLPTEPPFLGQLDADAVRELAARFDDALEVSAAAHAAGRDETPLKRLRRDKAVASLRTLFRDLLQFKADDRPTMRDVATRRDLEPYADASLDFFAYSTHGCVPLNGAASSRALRAKSMAQHRFISATPQPQRPKSASTP
ncbi:hypothetical protein CTAYLR_010537 [Chrysophaeum taylorii]|uniref:non-specific serine/threonine protein kinase n=1 Tax=Chrysophaeum taylorii TaxID=2483200 RepID=A0AAD7UHI2_9STRA|nr:hypothetical protein CTAYLR_010537 [Chrysophaeum taylorii]